VAHKNWVVPRQNLVHSQNEWLGDELDAAHFDKILAMIMSLRHLLDGWPMLSVPGGMQL
jgi:hypothetical protein